LNVNNIRLINFRNYENICLNFNKSINIFIGKNAQGKTNLMEAIYMCSTGRSFRTNRDREIINFNKSEAYIGANIKLGNLEKFIEIKMDQAKPKRIRINKNELTTYKDLYSGLNVIVFTPEKLKVIKDGPQERRNLIDDGINQIKPIYSYNLNKYKKILYQRNNLLKSSRFRKDAKDLLDVFDMQIVKVGSYILMERSRYVKDLAGEAKEIHGEISKGLEDLDISYVSNLPILETREKIEEAYLKSIKNNINRDLEYGTTEIGPHRDDIRMDINKKDVRIYGSQGQQRTVVLSLVLSEVNLIKKERQLYPVLILDDVFSELDQDRRKYLINLFGNLQVFITSTDYEDLKILNSFNRDVFYIEKGSLRN